jgi:hypothetical protein
MRDLMTNKTESRQFAGAVNRSLLLTMCFIAIVCACFAEGINPANDSWPSESQVIEMNNQQAEPDTPTPSATIETEPSFDTAVPAFARIIPMITSGEMQYQRVNPVEVMRINYPALYAQYSSGRRLQTGGAILTGLGGGAILLGFVIMNAGVAEDDDEIIGGGAVLTTAGVVSLGVGIPLLAVGGGKKRRAIREFNRQHYATQSSSPHFQLKVHPDRVGLAYVF